MVDVLFLLIEEKVHQFNLCDLRLAFRGKHLLRRSRVIRNRSDYFWTLLFLLFLDFLLNDTEEVSKLVIFSVFLDWVGTQEVFVQVLVCELHH